jgi:hypothetical protein
MAGVFIISSAGIVAIINRFSVETLQAIISPTEEKRQEHRNTPMMKGRGLVITLAGNPIASAATAEIMPIDISFESTYSDGFVGDTAMLSSTLSLFSKRTMAPIKKSPIAAGSEKIMSTAAFALHDAGNAKISAI